MQMKQQQQQNHSRLYDDWLSVQHSADLLGEKAVYVLSK